MNYYQYSPQGTMEAINAFKAYRSDGLYTGKSWDGDTTKLNYFHNRFQDAYDSPMISQDLVSPDLTQPLSLNEYLFCLNNPFAFLDLDGRLTQAHAEVFAEHMGSGYASTKYELVTLGQYIDKNPPPYLDCISSIGKSFYDLNNSSFGFKSRLGANWKEVMTKYQGPPGTGAVGNFYEAVQSGGSKYGLQEISAKSVRSGDLIVAGNLQHIEYIKNVKWENGNMFLQTIGASSGKDQIVTRSWFNPDNSWWSKAFGKSEKYIRVNE